MKSMKSVNLLRGAAEAKLAHAHTAVRQRIAGAMAGISFVGPVDNHLSLDLGRAASQVKVRLTSRWCGGTSNCCLCSRVATRYWPPSSIKLSAHAKMGKL